MSNVENEIVSITFDNDGFEKGVAEVMASLDALRASLDEQNGGDAFKGIEDAANSIDLSGIDAAVDSIDSKFSALGAVAFTAIQGVTTGAVDAAKSMFDNTLGQIISGGTQRSLAIEQAKFQFRGLGQDVEATMESALAAVQGTSYGLDEAATLAGVFGSAGIEAGTELTGALRGVAGVATITGRSFSEIGGVFQNVAALTHLTTNDINSLALRGLGFEEQAKALGITVEELRAQARDGSIDFRTFSAAMNEAFGDHATEANKTYTGALANLRAAMSRLGEVFIAPKLEATRNVFNALAPVIDKVKNALGPLIDAWKLFVNIQAIKSINFLDGLRVGRLERLVPDIVRILKNLYTAIGTFIKPIREAFQNIFPPVTGRNMESIALAIKRFTRALALSSETANKVKRIFSGVFAIFSIGFTIIKELVGVIFDIVKALSPVGGGFLEAGATVGDFLTALEKMLVDGGGIHDFFQSVGDQISRFIEHMKDSEIIQAFGDAISWVADSLSNLFDGASDAVGGIGQIEAGTGRIGQRFSALVDTISAVGSAIASIWTGLIDILSPVFDWLVDAFGGLGSAIADAMGDGNFDRVLDLINTGLFGGIVLLLKKFLEDGATIDLTGGVLGALEDTFSKLTDTLDAMQTQIKAGAIKKIAEAVLILTISLVALSLIDSAKLTKALGAMTIAFGELGAIIFGLTKLDLATLGGATGIITMAGAIVILAGAMILMSIAAFIFSRLDGVELAKGLTGIAASLIGLSVALDFMTISTSGTLVTAGTLLALAFAVGILAAATALFAMMEWDTLIRGLFGVGAALTGLTLAMKFIPADAGAKAPSILALSFSLIAMAKAVKKMGELSWDEIYKGLIGLGIALGGVVLVANAMEGSLAGAGAIAIISVSLVVLAFALEKFADIGWLDMIKGLLGMAAALVILAVAAIVFGALTEVVLPAAGGIALMSAAIYILAVALDRLGQIDFATFGKALLFMAGGLLAIAVASILLSPAIPFIALMGAALLVFGIGLLSIGAGLYLAARGLEIFATLGVDAVGNIKDIVLELAGLIPQLATELAKGILEFFQVIVDAAPGLVEGIAKLLDALFEAIIKEAPKYAEALTVLIQEGLGAVRELAPDFIQTGLFLITSFLDGLADNIPEICAAARRVVLALVGCLIENQIMLPRAGIRMILSFTQGIRSKIADVVSAGVSAVGRFVGGILSAIGRGVAAGVSAVARFIAGITQKAGELVGKGAQAVGKFISGLASKAGELLSGGLSAIGSFISGIAIGAAGLFGKAVEIGGQLISGLVSAIGAGLSAVIGAIRDLADRAVDAAKSFFGINSPSRRFQEIGDSVIEGLALGISNNGRVIQSVDSMSDDVISSMNKSAKKMSTMFDNVIDINPVITPVLDLTEIQNQATGISGILASSPVGADLSYAQAKTIAASAQLGDSQGQDTPDEGPRQVVFQQTINANTPLSSGEVYRQTKSQIKMAKDELEVA